MATWSRAAKAGPSSTCRCTTTTTTDAARSTATGFATCRPRRERTPSTVTPGVRSATSGKSSAGSSSAAAPS